MYGIHGVHWEGAYHHSLETLVVQAWPSHEFMCVRILPLSALRVRGVQYGGTAARAGEVQQHIRLGGEGGAWGV